MPRQLEKIKDLLKEIESPRTKRYQKAREKLAQPDLNDRKVTDADVDNDQCLRACDEVVGRPG